MTVDHAVFLRIDTASGKPYLEGSAGEIVVTRLLSAASEGWYDLIGFVALPCELQLLIVPHGKGMNEILNDLESVVTDHVKLEKPIDTTVFDTDYYREKIDSNEEIKLRLRWMHASPIRSRLTTVSSGYIYSSANERYRDKLPLSAALH